MIEQPSIDELLYGVKKRPACANGSLSALPQSNVPQLCGLFKILSMQKTSCTMILTALKKSINTKEKTSLSWLKQITVRKALNHLQTKEKHRWSVLEEETEEPSEWEEDWMMTKALT